MKYEILPFAEGDTDFIGEKIHAAADSIAPPEEGAKVAYALRKISDEKYHRRMHRGDRQMEDRGS